MAMNAVPQGKELVQESEWFRVYQIGPDLFLRESKFLTDQLETSLASVQQRWPGLSDEQRLDFAAAFVARPAVTVEDQQVLRFLLETGAEDILVRVASRLQNPADRKQALSLLLDRVASGAGGAAKYYQALALMGDPRAVPLLRRRYEEYRQRLSPMDLHGLETELADYQMCCHALWNLDGAPEYRESLEKLLTHPDETIRRRATLSLYERWP
jgi:HEAT repeat protein